MNNSINDELSTRIAQERVKIRMLRIEFQKIKSEKLAEQIRERLRIYDK